MNPIDIRDLAAKLADLRDNIASLGLDSHLTRGPLLVTRDGQPEAVIIRHKAYAPRLHHFGTDHGGIVCNHCEPPTRIPCDTSSLAVAIEAANRHWHDTHRQPRTQDQP